MRGLLWIGAAVTFVCSMLLTRIVLHGYTDHGQLDVFHLVIAFGSASVGVLIMRKLFRRRAA